MNPAPVNTPIVNALSLDVEEWFQVGAFEHTLARSDWDRLPSRVVFNTELVLDLFAEAGVTATCFILGWVAERHPELVRRIVEGGHEVASHGYDHRRVFLMTPAEFADDLNRTRVILEDKAGVSVIGYRAPSFSIDQRTPWAHAVLADQGYAYSSSVAPVRHDHYGWVDSPRFAWRPRADSALIELPVTTARLAGRALATGGGFFRLLPYGFSRWAVDQVNRAGQPAVLYMHPWEVDPDQPRVAGAPLRSRIRHYSNLHDMAGKLRRVLRQFAWSRIDALLPTLAAAAAPR